MLQAIASKVEILGMTDSEGILYTFDDPKAFCYDRYTYILKNVPPPLISEPLKIKPEIKLFLEGVASYLNADKICANSSTDFICLWCFNMKYSKLLVYWDRLCTTGDSS